MAGHGSPPAEDKANHPGRKVDVPKKKRDAQVAQIEKTRSTTAHRYAVSQIRKEHGY